MNWMSRFLSSGDNSGAVTLQPEPNKTNKNVKAAIN